METNEKLTVMECVENIVKFAEDCKLREPFFEEVSQEISYLSGYLNCEKTEAVFFACALAFWFDNSDFSKVFNHLGMKEFQILKYRNQIENLYERNLLLCSDRNRKQINKYEISQTVLIAVSKNLPLEIKTIPLEKQKKNFVDVLEEFDGKSEDFDRERIESYEFSFYIDELFYQYSEMPFFKKVKTFHLSTFEAFFLLDTVWDAVNSGDNDFNTGVLSTIEDFVKNKSAVLRHLNLLLNNESKLTKLNLIELSKESFRNRTKAKISSSFLKFLKQEENLQFEEFEKENNRLVQCKNIKNKELYYNENEIQSIETLQKTLTENQFKKLQKRLNEKAMPLGITVLLHGEPGTGKTETVYQLAKKSGRNIFKVDISETKSMWFGESQKLVKKIFTDYQQFKNEEKKCPILLFNEADAIIGKRKDAGSTNVAETENAIQNILLEEMEKFDGILFATTNLVGNMDAAFERRFLYKIRFSKPEIQNAAKIWNSKLPFLSEEESLQLASQFRFSGGEMENIARKMLMNEVLNNEVSTFKKVLEFCRNEKWNEEKSSSKIGF